MSVAQWQELLRTVTFSTTNQDPRPGRDIQFVVEDGMMAAGAFKTIAVVAVNDAPTVTPSDSTPSYTGDGAPSTVDAGLTVTDVDDAELVSGMVTISAGGQAGDALAFTAGTSGITDADPAADVLALTGTATVAQWQSVLRSVVFSTINPNPGASRMIRFVVNDGSASSVAVEKKATLVASG